MSKARQCVVLAVATTTTGFATPVYAQAAAKIDPADTTWMISATALVSILWAIAGYSLTFTDEAPVLGARRGYGSENLAPFDLSLAVIGTGLLWVGWFGFNGGSALVMISGAIAGLGTITPTLGFVLPAQGIVIGVMAGGICF